MSQHFESAFDTYTRVLTHLLNRVRTAEVDDEPFSHLYVQELLPADVYSILLIHLPPAEQYWTGPRALDSSPCVRTFFNLTSDRLKLFSPACRNVWAGVAAALTDPELKGCLYAKFAPELARRFGIEQTHASELPGYSRPTLYREVAGYELPAHPDSLKKVVTMHLYLPANYDQLHLGTTLYRRKPGTVSTGDWRENFTAVKQFEFLPNSGYAFAVNSNISRQSWHGCERLPPGAGIRNTLLNTFYTETRRGYSDYLE